MVPGGGAHEGGRRSRGTAAVGRRRAADGAGGGTAAHQPLAAQQHVPHRLLCMARAGAANPSFPPRAPLPGQHFLSPPEQDSSRRRSARRRRWGAPAADHLLARRGRSPCRCSVLKLENAARRTHCIEADGGGPAWLSTGGRRRCSRRLARHRCHVPAFAANTTAHAANATAAGVTSAAATTAAATAAAAPTVSTAATLLTLRRSGNRPPGRRNAGRGYRRAASTDPRTPPPGGAAPRPSSSVPRTPASRADPAKTPERAASSRSASP